MAKVTVVFQCGCGQSFNNVIEATVHADTKNHKLTVYGKIVPNKPAQAGYLTKSIHKVLTR